MAPEPLSPAGLRGHVVLVNFWTLTCINWLRQEPYVRAWSQAYRNDGLIVIGVHTPEFSFEHEIDRVRLAVQERGIDYPVALDNDYAIWTAFDNHYWPALYFIDTNGVIRDDHFGEGRYAPSERIIQRLLGIDREPVPVEGVGVEAAADWDHVRTSETYRGRLVTAEREVAHLLRRITASVSLLDDGLGSGAVAEDDTDSSPPPRPHAEQSGLAHYSLWTHSKKTASRSRSSGSRTRARRRSS